MNISGQNASKSLCSSFALPKCLNQLLGIEFSSLQMANLCGKCFQRFPQQMNGGSNHKSMWMALALHTHPWDGRADGGEETFPLKHLNEYIKKLICHFNCMI